jgi:RNA polymerase sigma-70 factor (ECF subfamily)
VSIANVHVQDALAGDEAAFVQLLEPLLPGAYRLAVGMLGSESEAEDAVQESVFKAWRNFSRFRRDADLKPWLFTIVANECRRRRRSRWWGVLKQPDPIEGKTAGTNQADPAIADLRLAVYRLPHDQRLVVVLRYYMDLSFDEVAQTLGISPKAAKSRTYRALERLRLSPEVLTDE